MVIIILGYILKQTKFLSDDAWSGIEKLTYFVLFPSLLIRTLGNQSLTGAPWSSMLIVIVATIMTSVVLLIVFRKVLSKNNAAFTSIFQGGVRFNTYIAFAIAQSLYGEAGLAMSSIAAGFMIVFINLWCISVFAFWGKATFQGVLAFVKEIMVNPLIIACVIGWFLSLSGIGLAPVVGDVFEIIGGAALPFGLLAVGAALNLKGIKGHLSPIIFSSILQFAIKPIVASSLIAFTGLTGVAGAVLIIAFMTPTAPSAYILARQLGGDTEIMASIITIQTLLAFLFMPILGMLLL